MVRTDDRWRQGVLNLLPTRRCPGRVRAHVFRSWALWLLPALWVVSGCTPTQDWRVMQPEGWSLSVAMPCRPSRHERPVTLGDASVSLAMISCSGAGHTYAVASASLSDPARMASALDFLVASAQANVQGEVRAEQRAKVPGMTPFAQAREVRLDGRRPDGQPLQMQVLVFAHGMRVYQATVLGRTLADEDVRPLFDSLVVKP